MRLVLDANIYLYALGAERKASCEHLIQAMGPHDVRIPRTVVDEVCRNLPVDVHSVFFALIGAILEEDCGIDEPFVVPYSLGQHYEDVGFKEADALIAAYADFVRADLLVTENRRHFHALADRLPFGILDAETFLRCRYPSG